MALSVVLFSGLVLSPLLGTLLPTKTFVVASGSMEPGIPIGSLVFASPEDISIGDVVVYASRAGVYQVHRVVEARSTGDTVHYLLRGDANDAADSFLVSPDEIVGTVQRHIPYAGHVWLVPHGLQLGLFSAALVGYLGLTWWESRGSARSLGQASAALMVALLVAPAVTAGITVELPESPPGADVLETSPLPFTDGDFGLAAVTSDTNNATVTLPTPKVWKEIVMWGCDHDTAGKDGCELTDASGTATAYDGSLTLVDTAALPSATFRLEIFGQSTSSSETLTVDLYNVDTASAVSGSAVVLGSGSPEWGVGSAFTLSGSDEYRFRYSASSGTSESLSIVKLVSLQAFATATETNVWASGADTTDSTSFAAPARSAYFTYDASGFDGTVTAYFEAVGSVSAGTILPDGEVRLYDVTGGSSVTGSTLTFTSSTLDRKRTADIASSLTEGNTYRADFRRSGGLVNPHFDLDLARLVVQQAGGFTETVRYLDFTLGNSTISTTYEWQGVLSRYRMDTEWGDRTGYLEAGVRNTGASAAATVRLYDFAAGAVITGSEISDAADTATRVRSSAFTLGALNSTLQIQAKADGGGATDVRNARLVVFQTAGKTLDNVLVTTNSGSPACSWHLKGRLDGSTGLSRLDSATLTIRNGATSEEQVVVTSGSVTTTSGSTVQVDGADTLEYVVHYAPNAYGDSTLFVRLVGDCGSSGVHALLDVVLELG